MGRYIRKKFLKNVILNLSNRIYLLGTIPSICTYFDRYVHPMVFKSCLIFLYKKVHYNLISNFLVLPMLVAYRYTSPNLPTKGFKVKTNN